MPGVGQWPNQSVTPWFEVSDPGHPKIPEIYEDFTRALEQLLFIKAALDRFRILVHCLKSLKRVGGITPIWARHGLCSLIKTMPSRRTESGGECWLGW